MINASIDNIMTCSGQRIKQDIRMHVINEVKLKWFSIDHEWITVKLIEIQLIVSVEYTVSYFAVIHTTYINETDHYKHRSGKITVYTSSGFSLV